MSSLTIEPFVFATGLPGLQLTAKRYTYTNTSTSTRTCLSGGFTLLFAHGTAHHKEHWEPTIEALFDLSLSLSLSLSGKNDTHGHVSIREAWAIDRLNHGDAAVLNEETLNGTGRIGGVTPAEDGAAICALLKSEEHFSGRRIIAIGHSLGATGLLEAAIAHLDLPGSAIFGSGSGSAPPPPPPPSPSRPPSPFATLIIIEPILMPRAIYERDALHIPARLTRAIAARRDTWESKDRAYEHMRARAPWRGWDGRVLRVYVEHGLRIVPNDAPNSTSTSKTKTVATLKCPKAQEGTAWHGRQLEATFEVVERLSAVFAGTPTHVVQSARADVLPRSAQDWLVNTYAHQLVSMKRIPSVGHHIPQEAPDVLAACIMDSLILSARQTQAKPKAVL